MGRFEMERVFLIGLGGAAILCLFGLVIGLSARLKGYSFLAWFGTGGTLLISALVLAFQPKLRGVELSEEQRAVSVQRGNRIGWILSVINVFLIVLVADTPLFSNFGETNYEDYVQRSFVPALQWIQWVYLIGMAIMFVRFICMPRGSRSPLLIAVFACLAVRTAWDYIGDAIAGSGEESLQKINLIAQTFVTALSLIVTFALCYLATEVRSKE